MTELIRKSSRIKGISTIGITTNGFLLDRYMDSLAKVGVNSLNVSLDTLDREKFKAIAGVEGFERVYSALMRATESGTA